MMWEWEKVYEWYQWYREEREESFIFLLAEERLEEREEEREEIGEFVFGSFDGWHITTRP
jgi:hypothetical protein